MKLHIMSPSGASMFVAFVFYRFYDLWVLKKVLQRLSTGFTVFCSLGKHFIGFSPAFC